MLYDPLLQMTDSIKVFIKSRYYLFKTIRLALGALGHYQRKTSTPLEPSWKERINTVLLAPDNSCIERVPDAGRIKGDIQIMHNGIKIHVGSYYGDANTVLLHKNKGVHEPQEEKIFEQIVSVLPEGSIMLELGAFWSFYSMTFQRKVERGINYMIEPDFHALLSGKNNFKLNNLNGTFFNYYISDQECQGRIPTITIDKFLEKHEITRLQILHSDIQGYELKMLAGADESLKQGKIDYLFISTHSNELHYDCIDLLNKHEYEILCSADLNETYSWDGLIVAKHRSVKGPMVAEISKRTN